MNEIEKYVGQRASRLSYTLLNGRREQFLVKQSGCDNAIGAIAYQFYAVISTIYGVCVVACHLRSRSETDLGKPQALRSSTILLSRNKIGKVQDMRM